MTTLIELAERVEAATAGEQRAMIFEAAKLEWCWDRCPDVNPDDWSSRWSRFHRMLDAEAYESAAMQLVPEGWRLNGLSQHLAPLPHCKARLEYWYDAVAGRAATPALALCAAALRAKAGEG